MENIEIERRFVLRPCSIKRFLKTYDLTYKKLSLEQFYKVATSDTVERYRRIGDRYIVTIKKGEGLVRREYEVQIDKMVYDDVKRTCGGARIIVKNRYFVDYEGRCYEMDRFKGALKGLNLLEIEFAEEREAMAFELPPIFEPIVLAEVTEDPRFNNGALAKSMSIPSIETSLSSLLREVERRENFLKATVEIVFDPMESSSHVVKAIIDSLLCTIDANAKAILSGDEEPERVHQLRVAMRKIRTLFSQMEGMFEKSWRRERKKTLAALMRQTGQKRDIDVYLSLIPEYRKMVPKKYAEGLNEIQIYLKKLEEEARERLQGFLVSESWEKELQTLRTFARSEETTYLTPLANRPILHVVKEKLFRLYREILKQGSAITSKSRAEAYHALRIEVKKLRYMMEFSASLFDAEAYRSMLVEVKVLQTILGEHQDLVVQREHLKAFLLVPELQTQKSKETIKALRHQIDRLEMKKREAFKEAFERFEKSHALFYRMICRFDKG